MKKKIAAALAATFALGVTSAFAANPFVDVPAKHWAYESVNKLAKAGIVDGYGDGTFRGDKQITRYEMAVIVAKAMTKLEKADAEQKAMINKLSAEFGAELNNLGVRVGALENKVGNIKIVAETKLGYTWMDQEGTADQNKIDASDAFGYRQRIHLSAPVTNKISYNARIQAEGAFGSGSSATSITRNFITVQDMFGIDSTMLGRQPIQVGRGLMWADTDNNDGIAVKHAFSKKFNMDAFLVEEAAKEEAAGINFNYAATKDLLISAGYYAVDPTTVTKTAGKTGTAVIDGVTVVTPAGADTPDTMTLKEKTKFWNAGFSYNFGKGVSFVGDYVKSDANGDPQAYAAQLVYNWKSGKAQNVFYSWEKFVKPTVAHDQGIALGYFNVEDQSLPGFGFAEAKAFGNVKNSKNLGDVKGWMFAYENVLAKNVVLSLDYTDAEDKTSGAKDKRVQANVEFFY